ncbi:MAG: hypothetical protein ABII82_19580 [Verrucomicrobiota bacterium]
MKTQLLIALVAPIVMLTGCQHHDAIVFATNTQIGARIGVGVQQVPEIQVGFNRQEGALVPLYLATPDDRAGEHHPVISGQLIEARDRLSKAAETPADRWTDEGLQSLKNAAAIIAAATEFNRDQNGNTVSSLLTVIHDKATELVADAQTTKPAVEHFAVIDSLINTEINKPALLAQFDASAKYIGKETGSSREDAYSVIAILDAGGSAKARRGELQQTEASGRVAQYFATGVAAQKLASQGPGVVGGTTTVTIQQLEKARKQGIIDAASLDTAASHIWGQEADNAQQRTARATTVLNDVDLGGEKPEDAAAHLGGQASKQSLRKALEIYNTPTDTARMLLNIKQS